VVAVPSNDPVNELADIFWVIVNDPVNPYDPVSCLALFHWLSPAAP
jgi:hypothetical protein